MLHRKLLLMMGPLIVLLLLLAVMATLLLSGMLSDLAGVSRSSLQRAADITAMEATLTTVESEIVRLRLEPGADADRLVRETQHLREQLATLGAARPESVTQETWAPRATEAFERLASRVARIAETREAAEMAAPATLAGDDAIALRESIAAAGHAALQDHGRQYDAMMARFRRTVLVLCLAFLVVLNVSIVMLLRASSMILRPVEQLVKASRHLAREEFDYRAPEDRHDEFGELARATNQMAAELRRNERRKIETLHQVARTLNHEVQNAIAIVELQLELVSRSAGRDDVQETRLRQIRAAMERMSATVDALTRVRRIVLTDYIAGLKMLDLERSVEMEPAASPTLTGTAAESEPA